VSDMRTPMSRVRGLGAAKEGVGHFWAQRLTAMALAPLAVAFIASLIANVGADYDAFRAWLASPLAAAGLLLLLLVGFYHMKLGLQVVIEDYIHGEGVKLLLLTLNNFWAAGVGLLCVYSVVRVSLAG